MASNPKKGIKNGSKLGFLDECGISERPNVQRTWSPKGKTPVILSTGSWRVRSVIGVVTCTARGNHPKFYLRIFKNTIHSLELIRFIKGLRHHIRGRLILLMDRLAAHRSNMAKAFFKSQRHWLKIEWFPAYAPELNPVEYPWSNGKRKEFANHCTKKSDFTLEAKIRKYARRIRRKPKLLKGFLRASTLFK